MSASVPSTHVHQYPRFDLARLLQTVFNPKKDEKLCILIDLENPSEVVKFSFLQNIRLPIQRKAYEVFYQGLQNGIMAQLELAACDFFAYKMTGGSNLELPNTVIAPDGTVQSLTDVYSHYDIILCIGTYSATAPLTAAAKKYGFRGGTMHGVNDIILSSGLAVDYNEVSRETEILRKGMTQADYVDIDFEVDKHDYHLHIELEQQEAQKSQGICRKGPDVANLPAGEVYFVPTNASGSFPIKFEEDGTIGLMQVDKGKVQKVSLLRGNQKTVNKYQSKFDSDPASAILGELGFGTQVLPFSGADIQDEKIFGTFHLATGRNDHLNGSVTLDRFHDKGNATHDDILFSSTKTPEIHVKQVRMMRHGKLITLIENYKPSDYLLNLLKSAELSGVSKNL
jgi:aminopeptidase